MRILVPLLTLVPVVAAAQPDEREPSLLAMPVVAVGGGVAGFVSPTLREVSDDGGAWNARIAAGDPKAIRLELSYTGAAQPLDSASGTLLKSGALVQAHINVGPWVSSVEPFMYLGAGLAHYRVRGDIMHRDLAPTDNVLELPIGAGVAKRVGRYVFDVRAGLEIASGADLLRIPKESGSSRTTEIMHRFAMAASLGFAL
jgi:hypothetical protein